MPIDLIAASKTGLRELAEIDQSVMKSDAERRKFIY
jgi:hypothetical protein